MYCKSARAGLAFDLVGIVVCLMGQALSYYTSLFGFEIYLYYTNVSNVLCLVYFVVAAIWHAKAVGLGPAGSVLHSKRATASAFPRFAGAIVLVINVTLLVYWLVLRGMQRQFRGALAADEATSFAEWLTLLDLRSIDNYIVHLVVPALTILGWLIFVPKGRITKIDPVIWLSIPLVYYLVIVEFAHHGYIYGDGTRYPYFFIDPDIISLWGVIGCVALMVIGFLGLGYAVFGVDRLLSRVGGPHTSRGKYDVSPIASSPSR